MDDTQKKNKICMLGAFAVGKTSLVARFVKSIFSEKYHTTVGVKIDKKTVAVNGQTVHLILWDLAGEDEFLQVRMSYMRGTSGYLLVADGTRPETLAKAVELKTRCDNEIGAVPFILVLNKADLVDEWRIADSQLLEYVEKGWTIFQTSAKSGQYVEEVFSVLAGKILA